jgi:hypothetical protein
VGKWQKVPLVQMKEGTCKLMVTQGHEPLSIVVEIWKWWGPHGLMPLRERIEMMGRVAC